MTHGAIFSDIKYGTPNIQHYAQGYIAMYGLFLKHTNSIKFRRKYKADKYYKMARKVVSNYARSEFL